MGHAPDGGGLVGDEGRIALEERVDQHGVTGKIETKGGVPEPGDLHDMSSMAALELTAK
jgi:hypothetical protein